MVETNLLSSFSIIFRLVEMILKKLKKDSLKQDLALSLEIPIKRAERSFENLNFSIYTYLGAGIFGNIIEPPFPKETSQKIVDDIEFNYKEFIQNFKELSKYFDAHMDEFRDILSHKEILALEAFVKAYEGNDPDYEFLMNHGAIKTPVLKEIRKKKTFNIDLGHRINRKMKKNPNFIALGKALQSEQINTQQLIIETMMRIVMEKQLSINSCAAI